MACYTCAVLRMKYTYYIIKIVARKQKSTATNIPLSVHTKQKKEYFRTLAKIV